MRFDVALYEKEAERGLTKEDVLMLIALLEKHEVFPLEIMAKEHESSAMGFITTVAADKFDFDMNPLCDFVASILDDMDLESKNGIYEFNGLKIYLSRN